MSVLSYAVALAVVLILAVALWLALGRGPRRQRALQRAQRLLEAGSWEPALAVVQSVEAQGGLSAAWQERLRTLAGECHQLAGDQALKERHYEDSLRHHLAAVPLLGAREDEQRRRVLDAMLAEVRRLFAAGTDADATQAVEQLIARTLALQSPCAEATFWQALCQLRRMQYDAALTTLTAAHEQAGKQFLDPPLYLGILLHRLGRSHDALRYLAEANRLDGGCPFVTWQMGIALVAVGGHSGLATKALQRALGPRGLGLWAQNPSRAWVEAFPEERSYVRRLAAKYPFVCPLLGDDLALIVRQGQQALAQAHYRQGNFQEAADLFGKLLQEMPPTLPLLRGLGLSLARLQRYDQAYKHLRTALEQENPKDPFTAGYLALCGALGKPTQPEDRPRNVAWAVRLLARYPVPDNAEWAGLLGAVHAEARALGLELAKEDQLLLCDSLAAVRATDERAADAYGHLARTFPDAVRPEHAWLYARAASVQGVNGNSDLDLFALTFRDSAPAREYFARQEWDFDAAEYTYLERSAATATGRFPEALGPDYPARGESFLLERSRREEAAGRKEAARKCVEVLLRLAPHSLAGHDRLACLHYRDGDRDQAVTLLSNWQRLAPDDHWPLVRQAIIEQERGNAARRAEAIDRALGLTRGRLRGAIAFLGARLALREWSEARGQGEMRNGEPRTENEKPDRNSSFSVLRSSLPGFSSPSPLTPDLERARALLRTCLEDDPDHTEALWCLAAVRTVQGDREGLAKQAAAMDRPEVRDARFHYLGAVCNLAARDYGRVLELARRSAEEESLAAESHYVMAWAHLQREDPEAAQKSLRLVAATEKSPSAVYARALLGQLSFARGAYDETIRWWSQVEPQRRAEWGLDEPLRQTILLAGLSAYENGRYEHAAERFREAGKFGLRDRRLGPLLTLALVKAGQRLLYEQVK